MTEQHRAEPEVWAAVEKWSKNDMDTVNCTLELRARVEALEAAQRTNVRPELQNLPEGTRLLGYRVENSALPVEEWGKGHMVVDSAKPVESNDSAEPDSSLVGRQPWAAMSFRGTMLLAPLDCADPNSWIAERIYEMGLADGKNATTGNTAPVTRDRAEDAAAPSHSLMERVADAIYMNAMGGYCEQARAAILAVADWFEQQGLFTTATRLRQEVK